MYEMMQMKREEKELLTGATATYVDTIVGRAVVAQKEFHAWSEEATDRLLQALALRVSSHAEELAIAAVQEMGMGNVRDKTFKNRFASLDIYRSLKGRVGQGCLAIDKRRKVMTLASPMGVVFALVPVTHPTSTFIVADEQAGMKACEELLALEGSGHTAIIYTRTPRLMRDLWWHLDHR